MLTKGDVEWLENIFSMAEDFQEVLSDWERNFCGDIQKKYDNEGKQLRLSEKQLERLQVIEEKLENA